MNSIAQDYGAYLIQAAEAMEAKVEAHKNYSNLPRMVIATVQGLASAAVGYRANGEALIAGEMNIRSLVEKVDLTDSQIETILRSRINQGSSIGKMVGDFPIAGAD